MILEHSLIFSDMRITVQLVPLSRIYSDTSPVITPNIIGVRSQFLAFDLDLLIHSFDTEGGDTSVIKISEKIKSRVYPSSFSQK